MEILQFIDDKVWRIYYFVKKMVTLRLNIWSPEFKRFRLIITDIIIVQCVTLISQSNGHLANMGIYGKWGILGQMLVKVIYLYHVY